MGVWQSRCVLTMNVGCVGVSYYMIIINNGGVVEWVCPCVPLTSTSTVGSPLGTLAFLPLFMCVFTHGARFCPAMSCMWYII